METGEYLVATISIRIQKTKTPKHQKFDFYLVKLSAPECRQLVKSPAASTDTKSNTYSLTVKSSKT
jgi:hypothetical protein